jgi:archaellum biogenesis protein FlaJ (TadC family)
MLGHLARMVRNMCLEIIKRFWVLILFTLFASIFGGIAVIVTAGKEQVGSYVAGVFGGLVVAFVMLIYTETILKKNSTRNRK